MFDNLRQNVPLNFVIIATILNCGAIFGYIKDEGSKDESVCESQYETACERPDRVVRVTQRVIDSSRVIVKSRTAKL